MQDETHRPIAGQISTAKKKTTLATRDRSFPTSLMELSKMSVPTSAHLCKVEHHPVGAKLSHASANLSLSLSSRFLSGPFHLDSLRSRSTTPANASVRLTFPSSFHPCLSPPVSSFHHSCGMLWNPPLVPPLSRSLALEQLIRERGQPPHEIPPSTVSFSRWYSAVFSISSSSCGGDKGGISYPSVRRTYAASVL